MRLEKYLADCGLGTRSECKALLRRGAVRVNGAVEKNGAAQVTELDHIFYQDRLLTLRKNLYLMFHKPAGCICATKDETQRTVLDYFPKELSKRLLIAGRLDKDTEGFLLLTDDGALIHELMSPKRHVEKTYFFRAYGLLPEDAQEQADEGIDIGDEKPTLPARFRELYVTIEHLDKPLPSGQTSRYVTEGCLVISEGRYHQVKRMLAALGCRVTYLKRVKIGHVPLDEKLKPGEYRELTEDELFLLRS